MKLKELFIFMYWISPEDSIKVHPVFEYSEVSKIRFKKHIYDYLPFPLRCRRLVSKRMSWVLWETEKTVQAWFPSLPEPLGLQFVFLSVDGKNTSYLWLSGDSAAIKQARHFLKQNAIICILSFNIWFGFDYM